MDKTMWKDIMDTEFVRMKDLADQVRTLMKSPDSEVRKQAIALQSEWNQAAARHSEAFKKYFDLNEG